MSPNLVVPQLAQRRLHQVTKTDSWICRNILSGHSGTAGHSDNVVLFSRMSSRFGLLPAGFVPPCLPSGSKAPPSGKEWLHEIKHDGFRGIARNSEALDTKIKVRFNLNGTSEMCHIQT
jgi:ATP-dependent DNA ligase